ncbi:MAG: helix-turn-helix domain-containing protein [Lentisphaerae bacterium]|nr:helix-turn-helix domain-containing protein [Lentisphaerota bacterium]
MKRETYLTTGEAAQWLGLSRSTISRRFDGGELTGPVNPVTGERLISRDSLLRFVRRHDLPVDTARIKTFRIVLGAPPGRLRERIDSIVHDDDRLRLDRAASGADVLVACGTERPDLVVLDAALDDMPPERVIRTLKARAGRRPYRILCGGPAGALPPLRRAGADAAVDTVHGSAAALSNVLYTLLDLPASPPPANRPMTYQRRWSRLPVAFNARVRVTPDDTPGHAQGGTARVSDLSRGGARLTDIRMDAGTLPAKPFRLILEIDEPALPAWKAVCRVVRLGSRGNLDLAVQFDSISDADRAKIAALHVG